MKKLTEGRYELFTTKEDAIDKFVQIQGISRERMTSGNAILFSCYKDGKIFMTNPPSRNISADNATTLCGQVIEQDGKTYVSYYTSFSNTVRVMKYFGFIFYILSAIICIAITVITREKIAFLLSCLLLGISLFHLATNPNEKISSPKDSEILVKELEKRVEAVNQWEK